MGSAWLSRSTLVEQIDGLIARAEREEQSLMAAVESHRDAARLAEEKAHAAHTVREETSRLKAALASALGR